eukprot:TRINITY_DN14883_c0_g1_i1.p3 TRINITY_DN14883_c0_g1~~TRINITY_DN14883_c0_g1_i1.p3  ORF type:complete len:105 (+),score=20.70 TRINITY_DN14883_c0_g1_i1:449-763(+)
MEVDGKLPDAAILEGQTHFTLALNFFGWAAMALALLFNPKETFPILNLCCDHGRWRSLELELFKWPKGLPDIDAISWYLLSKPNMFYYHLMECDMLKISFTSHC